MYKTIIGVVRFLVAALILQLYEQARGRDRIVRQQEEAEKTHSDMEIKAEEAEIARQSADGIHAQLTPAADSIVPETFRVSSGAPKEFTITVDTSRMIRVNLSGHFGVSGGSTGGVEVFLFDEDDYINWMYGNSAVALFSSGRESMGDVHASIAKSGRYYLVFKNDASIPNLDIMADIQMQYEKVIG